MGINISSIANGIPGVDGVNSTAIPLNNGETFTGEWTNSKAPELVVALACDVSLTYKIQFSINASDIDSTLSYNFVAGVPEVPHRLVIARQYYRLVIENNSGSNATYLRAQVREGSFGPLTSALNGTLWQDSDTIVTRSIPPAVDIARGNVKNWSVVTKFGQNTAISTTAEDIWSTGGLYNWQTSAQSLEILSGSGNDTSAGSGAQVVTVYGLDANWDFQEEEVTMNGATPVPLSNTYIRIYRMRVTRRGSYTGTNAGVVTLRVSGGGAILATIDFDSSAGSGHGSTAMSMYSVPRGHKLVVSDYLINIEASKPVNVYAYVRTNANDVTTPYSGQYFTPLEIAGAQGTFERKLTNKFVIPEYSDVWFAAYATGATTGFVKISYTGVLIKDETTA